MDHIANIIAHRDAALQSGDPTTLFAYLTTLGKSEKLSSKDIVKGQSWANQVVIKIQFSNGAGMGERGVKRLKTADDFEGAVNVSAILNLIVTDLLPLVVHPLFAAFASENSAFFKYYREGPAYGG